MVLQKFKATGISCKFVFRGLAYNIPDFKTLKSYV